MDCDDLQVHVSSVMAISPFYIFFSTTWANSFYMNIDEWVLKNDDMGKVMESATSRK